MMRRKVASFQDIARDPDARLHILAQADHSKIETFGPHTLRDSAAEILELEDAILHATGGVLWKGYWINGCSIHYYPEDWPSAAWRPGNLDDSGEFIDLDPIELGTSTQITEPAMFCDSGWGAINFGHFVHDFLPYGRLFRLLRGIQSNVVPLSNPMRWESQNLIMEGVFGVSRAEFAKINGNTRVSRLFLPRRQTVFDKLAWTTSFAGLRDARDLALLGLGINSSVGTFEKRKRSKILLHRQQDVEALAARGHLMGRNFENTLELIGRLVGIGFVVLEPGLVSIEIVAGLLSRAEIVVGVHGANLGNILFCPPGARVFELRPASGVWSDYEAIGAVLGHNFTGVVQPRPDEGAAGCLDVDSLIRLIES